MQEITDGIYIKITENGPYLIYGNPVIKQEFITPNERGESWEYKDGKTFSSDTEEPYIALCRCGQSSNKPFCDETHLEVDFIGTETATNRPILEEAEAYEGDKYTLLDNEAYCAFARFCDAFGQVWNLVQHESPEAQQIALREALNCPSGRLMMQDNKTGKLIEKQYDKEISLLEDPVQKCSGALFVKGGIKIESADGRIYQIRNRVTLCRCGKSQNKPFCNGSHATVHFDDEI